MQDFHQSVCDDARAGVKTAWHAFVATLTAGDHGAMGLKAHEFTVALDNLRRFEGGDMRELVKETMQALVADEPLHRQFLLLAAMSCITTIDLATHRAQGTQPRGGTMDDSKLTAEEQQAKADLESWARAYVRMVKETPIGNPTRVTLTPVYQTEAGDRLTLAPMPMLNVTHIEGDVDQASILRELEIQREKIIASINANVRDADTCWRMIGEPPVRARLVHVEFKIGMDL